jgi:hypothetical protein
MGQFDVEAAKKAGYSEDEILSHLTKTRKFDIAGATKSGYSKKDIIQHLGSKPAPSPFSPEGAPGIPAPTVQMQEAPGFLDRAIDSSVVGMAGAVGKRYAGTPGQNPIVRAVQTGAGIVGDMATAAKDRFVANPRKIGTREQTFGGVESLPTRAVDAVFGPTVDAVEEDLRSGNLAGVAGTVVGAGSTLALPVAGRAVSKAKSMIPGSTAEAAGMAESAISSRGGPMSRTVKYADQQGLPTTVGERTGSKMLQTAERAAEVIPGASGTATEFYAGRNAQVAAKGKELTSKVGKVAEDPTAAGEAVKARVEGRAADLKGFYGKRYDAVEKTIEKATERKQTQSDAAFKRQERQVKVENADTLQKWIQENHRRRNSGYRKTLPEPELKPLPEPTKVTPAAVDMEPIRQGLKTFYDELTTNMPTTIRESSPGYQRIKTLVEDTRSQRGALELERDLGEIKGLLRSESKGYAATPSGRYAAATIKELEGQITGAIREAGGPLAVLKLKQARSGVKEMHRTFEALDKIFPKGESPVKAFERLTAARDTNLNKLLEIKKRAPEAVSDIAATYLEGALGKMTGEAGTADMKAVSTAWKRLGPRTKRELFGAQTEELNAFFENAPGLVRNINPSGSGNVVLAGKIFGAGGTIVGALSGGGFAALPEAAAIAGAGVGSANLMAKFLFRKGNATKVLRALESSPDTAAGKVHWKRLNAAAEADPALLAAIQSARSAQQGSEPIQ